MALLSPIERASLAERLPLWRPVTGRQALKRGFHFIDFKQAFAFMTQVALLAERRDHHPEIYNLYNRVELILTSHDVGGLSMRDVQMAEEIDAFAPR